MTLLQTKLHRPLVPRGLVLRSRLFEQLDRGLSVPLTLVCAAAGFGKSTLVSSWLAANEERATQNDDSGPRSGSGVQRLPYAWLSLDEHDSDQIVFLSYFVAAIQAIFADACIQTQTLLRARQEPPLELFATTLINDLALLPGPFLVVLDDFGSIQGEAVHELLNAMVQHWPQSMHLVLITRHNPPLPLARLRAQGQISETRSKDLRFTREEMAAYVSQALPGLLNQSALDLLEERTDGWIAGLQLATLSLRDSVGDDAAMAVLSSSDANAAQYLVDEVLSRQPPSIQAFLLRTSILDRFCAPLCAAVVGAAIPDCVAQSCLEWIKRADLFIISLDHQQEWYRYHHLFQDMLRQRLRNRFGPDEVIRLHRKAAEWFAGRGLIEETLHHSLAAGDLDAAARLMQHRLCDVLNREDRPTLERWLRLLPEELIARSPWLLMIRAWTLSFSWQLGVVSRVLQQVEALIDEDGEAMLHAQELGDLRLLRGQIAGLRGQEAYTNNLPARAVAYCQEALALLPEQWVYARGGFILYLALSMQALGQDDVAEHMLLDHYEGLADKTGSYAVRCLMALAFNYLQSGQLELTRQTAEVMLHHASRSALPVQQGWAHFCLGTAYWQWNDLDQAGQHFGELVDKRYIVHAHAARNGLIGQALVHQARGESAEAWQVLDLLSRYDLDLVGTETDETRSLRAKLLMLQGDMESARRWADAFTGPVPDRPLLWLHNPHLTRARILLARGTAADVRSALEIADATCEIAERTHNTRFKITGLVFRALALDAGGQAGAAQAALRQAVELAQPGGFVRVFVDASPRMQDMLSQLAGQGFAEEAVHRILAAFPGRQAAMAEDPGAQPGHPPSLVVASLVEPLTSREREILALLREPLSGKEIAQRLFISIATFKRHTSNIYGKLGVHRRWDAVAAAEALGIFHSR